MVLAAAAMLVLALGAAVCATVSGALHGQQQDGEQDRENPAGPRSGGVPRQRVR
ncbi:hypothetical protein [Amycolatopsis minnesotensis]|uniref:Uncharacterized protein n=1 Tax=Amycolatopsis minnesotensis TaxID=337894 RepID=A0ABP5CUI7_9PSEU